METNKKGLNIVVIPIYVRDTIHSLGYKMGDIISLLYSNKKTDIVKIFEKISDYDLKDTYLINEIFNQYILGKKFAPQNELLQIIHHIVKWNIDILEAPSEDKLEVIKLLTDSDSYIVGDNDGINNIVDCEIVDKYLFIYPKIGFGNLLLNINSIKDKENNINFNEWFIRNINDYVFNKIDRTTFYNSSLFKRLTRLIINKK